MQEAIVPSASVGGQCAVPRSDLDPWTNAPYPDKPGSSDSEKSWVRAWIDETYLWFDEVGAYSAKDYATPQAYFDVLKTTKTTASGRPKDRFHFSAPTTLVNANALGTEIGYGASLAFLSTAVPRDIRVAFVEPGSPADKASVVRGDRVISVDGISIDATSDADIAKINAALAPQNNGEQHAFTLRDGTDRERVVTLAADEIMRDPVPSQYWYVYNTRGGKTVGYIVFNEHIGAAEYGLASAMLALQPYNITDLVIDMRYNGGGLVAIASQLAYMAGSKAMVNGTPLDLTQKTFEQLHTNSKNPFQWTGDDTKVPFYSQTLGYSAAAGQALPQLGLSHVTVLTGPDTCSASEALVNGLRGVGVTVTLVGGTTCGKPYGFFPEDNCGTTYFAIQTRGTNDQGFGDYGDGFAPACVIADDFAHQLGDPDEARLDAALRMIDGGACPTAALAKGHDARLKAEAARLPYLRRSPMREIKWLQNPRAASGSPLKQQGRGG